MGRAARARPGRAGAGVRFDPFAAELREEVREFVARFGGQTMRAAA